MCLAAHRRYKKCTIGTYRGYGSRCHVLVGYHCNRCGRLCLCPTGRDMSYSVPHPSGDGQLELLSGISGFCKPGEVRSIPSCCCRCCRSDPPTLVIIPLSSPPIFDCLSCSCRRYRGVGCHSSLLVSQHSPLKNNPTRWRNHGKGTRAFCGRWGGCCFESQTPLTYSA